MSYSLPSNSITGFVQDDQGYVWISTAAGLCKYDGAAYRVFTCAGDSLSLNDDNIIKMFMDSDGDIWVANQAGFAVWSHDHFRTPEHSTFNLIYSFAQLIDNEVIISDRNSISRIDKETLKEKSHFIDPHLISPTCLAVKETNEIWTRVDMNNPREIYVLNSELSLVDKITCPIEVQGMCHIQDRNLIMLYGDAGAVFYRVDTHRPIESPQWCKDILSVKGASISFVTSYLNGDLLVGVVGRRPLRIDTVSEHVTESTCRVVVDDKSMYTCYVDKDDNIWISSDIQPNFKFAPSRTYCSTIVDEISSLKSKFVMTVSVDSNGFVWMRTMNDLVSYDAISGKISYHEKGSFGEFCIDSKDRLWVMGYDTNVSRYILSNGKAIFDRKFTFDERPLSVCVDDLDNIWVATAISASRIDDADKITTCILDNNIRATGLYSSGEGGSLYLTTVNDGIMELVQSDITFKKFDSPVKNPCWFQKTSDGSLWLGSFNEGLYRVDPDSGATSHWDTSNGLLENHVKTIIEDRAGNIWIGCPTIITKMDLDNESFSHIRDVNYYKNGIYAGSTITRDGTLYYGGTSGITTIRPSDVRRMNTDHQALPIYLESMYAGGYDITSLLTTDGVPVVLHHDQSRLAFSFSAIEFLNGPSILYSFYLEGYDKGWSDPLPVRATTYTKIPAGHYTFRVKARNLNGEWSSDEISIPIVIKPAIYATWWAKVLYLLLAICAIVAAVSLYTRYRFKGERLRLAERNNELTKEHMEFLTNISHELRTPLSMIVAPITQLQNSESLTQEERELTDYISRSTQKLSAITEKIMSTGRSDIKREKPLKVAYGDMNAFVRALCDNFRFVTSDKGLKLNVNFESTLGFGYFDYEKLERILDNLLSNATKYTDEGSITVSVSAEGDNVRITVSDTGCGISEEDAKVLFSRFERLNMDRNRPEIKGSGVGLNYALQLARLHRGTLVYQRSDVGSTFILTVPYAKSMYAENEIDTTAVDPMASAEDNAMDIVTAIDQSKNTILIVEDNSDVREYLRLLLFRMYNILEAEDGDQAMDYLNSGRIPDLVLSDVVMPNKDGFELCVELKTSQDYAAIPIILLTAKTDMENRLKGLDCGADAYIEKPFNPFHIMKQIEALLSSRGRLQQVLGNLTSKTLAEISDEFQQDRPVEDVPQISERDRKFLEKLYANIESHISDGEYSVTNMSDDMNLSYSSLYARVKSLTGITPQALFSTYRMNKAMELLKKGEYTISDVCYMVGASSLSNFNRSFKRQFGIPPSEVPKN